MSSEKPDSQVVQKAIEHRTAHGRPPTYLFLGKAEVELYRKFLTESWGEEPTDSKLGQYYLGLELVSVDKPSMARIGGRQTFKRVTKSKTSEKVSSHWRLGIE